VRRWGGPTARFAVNQWESPGVGLRGPLPFAKSSNPALGVEIGVHMVDRIGWHFCTVAIPLTIPYQALEANC
jgi:hypothetical protein